MSNRDHGSSDTVTRNLVQKIQSGVWPPGHRLPPERQLASEYGIARNTLRRALKALEDEGLLVRAVGRGTFVHSKAESGVRELLNHMQTASPSDVLEVRLLIEPQAAALAAHRANDEDLRALDEVLRQSLNAKGTAEFEYWDGQLHLAIFRAAKNALLVDYCEALNAVRTQPRWYRLKQNSMNETLRLTYDQQHSAIVSALKERDADSARRALYEHLRSVQSHMLGATGLENPETRRGPNR